MSQLTGYNVAIKRDLNGVNARLVRREARHKSLIA